MLDVSHEVTRLIEGLKMVLMNRGVNGGWLLFPVNTKTNGYAPKKIKERMECQMIIMFGIQHNRKKKISPFFPSYNWDVSCDFSNMLRCLVHMTPRHTKPERRRRCGAAWLQTVHQVCEASRWLSRRTATVVLQYISLNTTAIILPQSWIKKLKVNYIN